MGKMGEGGGKSPPPDRQVSFPAGHSDELQLSGELPLWTSYNSQTHFAKRHRDFISRVGSSKLSSKTEN